MFLTFIDIKKANIKTPNDGLCHLNASGDYTASLIQDYPSLEQLKEAIDNNSITIIFAIRSGALGFYTNITKNFKASSVGTLEADSKNILELITKEYDKIHSRIQLESSKPTTDELTVRYFSNCHDEQEKETHLCEKLPKEGQIKFTISIDLRTCPKDPKDWNQNIRVSPVGLPIYLDIEANMVCNL